MKGFDTDKWFSKFVFDQKKGGKNELCSTKIAADAEQMKNEIQQKHVESPPVCNGRIDSWLRLIFHHYNYYIKLTLDLILINLFYTLYRERLTVTLFSVAPPQLKDVLFAGRNPNLIHMKTTITKAIAQIRINKNI